MAISFAAWSHKFISERITCSVPVPISVSTKRGTDARDFPLVVHRAMQAVCPLEPVANVPVPFGDAAVPRSIVAPPEAATCQQHLNVLGPEALLCCRYAQGSKGRGSLVSLLGFLSSLSTGCTGFCSARPNPAAVHFTRESLPEHSAFWLHLLLSLCSEKEDQTPFFNM